MISADYFIFKDKSSPLASYCEDIRIRGNKKDEISSIGKTKSI